MAEATPAPTLTDEMNEHREMLDAFAGRFVGREEDEMVLFRFARGWKWDLDAATVALEKTCAWKKQHGVDAAYKQRCASLKQKELTHAEVVMSYYPHNIYHSDCPNGAPLSLERTAHIDPDSLVANVTFEQFERYHIEHMENKYAQVNRLSKERNQLIGNVKIMDLDGLGSKHLAMTARHYLSAAIHISQQHYPEMLNKLIIINVPWLFTLIWAIVKPWLHERTLAKIVILGSDFRDTIKEHLPAGIIPDWAGGECVCPGGCVYEPHLAAPPTEIYIPAGSSHGVDLELDAAGSTASWSFTPTYYDIDYSISFTPKASKTVTEVQAQQNVVAKRFVQGQYHCTEPGTLTLTFNNPYWLYSKPVQYRVEAIAAVAIESAEAAATGKDDEEFA